MDDMMSVNGAMLTSGSGPARIGIHGVEGSRKTTTAAYLPAPLFVCAEQGIPRDLGFAVKTLSPRRWEHLFDIVRSLTRDEHPYQSLVIDTVDWVEPLIHKFVCARDSDRQTEMNPRGKPLISIEDYGYGKGYIVAEEEFRRLIEVLDIMQHERGIHVALISHSAIRTFKNPSGPDFDRYEPKCHARITAVIKEWVEHLLFFFYRVDASKEEADLERAGRNPERARAKGTGGREHIIGAGQCAMYDAKNRARLPAELELDDPNKLIAQLLGDHLVNVESISGAPARRADLSRPPMPGVALDSQAAVRNVEPPRDAEPPRRDAYTSPERAAPPPATRQNAPAEQLPAEQRAAERWGRNGDVAANGQFAHHESRADDERARREEAFAKARAGGGSEDGFAAAREGVEQRDRARADSRQWTEPRSPTTQAPEPASRAGANEQQRDARRAHAENEHALIEKLTKAQERALQALGPRYRAEVDRWVTSARDDRPEIPMDIKVTKICNRIEQDIAANAAQRPA